MNKFSIYFWDVLKNKYAQFSGRARRAEFWYFVLFLISIGVVFVDILLGATGILALIYSLALFVPGLAIGIRRLHDIGRSGWFYLISAIPIVGPIWLLVLFFKPGTIGTNEYGPDPKGPHPQDMIGGSL